MGGQARGAFRLEGVVKETEDRLLLVIGVGLASQLREIIFAT